MKQLFLSLIAFIFLGVSLWLFLDFEIISSSDRKGNDSEVVANKNEQQVENGTENDETDNENPIGNAPSQNDNSLVETDMNEWQGPLHYVPYKGIVEHIFFHPLIAYPELAFDGDFMEQGYNDYFTTIPEFERILEEMYKRDFILVHLSDVYEEINGEVVAKTLYLPEGKKPFVISIDDLNYYEYMIQNGNVFKLILDDNGKIATYSINPQGEEIISYTDEIITILDRFVEQNPDFSLNGAKGTIALTGYEGILGYRTQEGSPNRQEEINAVKPIIEELKRTGWIFASHSYGHINVTNVSLERLISDSEAWKREVESLIGPTPLYIYPYGARAEYDSAKFKYLVDSGFKVISAVGPTSYTKVINGAYTMDRRHMDGIGFILQPHTLRDIMDVDYVLDKTNRPAKFWAK